MFFNKEQDKINKKIKQTSKNKKKKKGSKFFKFIEKNLDKIFGTILASIVIYMVLDYFSNTLPNLFTI